MGPTEGLGAFEHRSHLALPTVRWRRSPVQRQLSVCRCQRGRRVRLPNLGNFVRHRGAVDRPRRHAANVVFRPRRECGNSHQWVETTKGRLCGIAPSIRCGGGVERQRATTAKGRTRARWRRWHRRPACRMWRMWRGRLCAAHRTPEAARTVRWPDAPRRPIDQGAVAGVFGVARQGQSECQRQRQRRRQRRCTNSNKAHGHWQHARGRERCESNQRRGSGRRAGNGQPAARHRAPRAQRR